MTHKMSTCRKRLGTRRADVVALLRGSHGMSVNMTHKMSTRRKRLGTRRADVVALLRGSHGMNANMTLKLSTRRKRLGTRRADVVALLRGSHGMNANMTRKISIRRKRLGTRRADVVALLLRGSHSSCSSIGLGWWQWGRSPSSCGWLMLLLGRWWLIRSLVRCRSREGRSVELRGLLVMQEMRARQRG